MTPDEARELTGQRIARLVARTDVGEPVGVALDAIGWTPRGASEALRLRGTHLDLARACEAEARARQAVVEGRPFRALGSREVPTCGTNGGYHRHTRTGEPQCGPCRAAHASYMREHRAAKRGDMPAQPRRIVKPVPAPAVSRWEWVIESRLTRARMGTTGAARIRAAELSGLLGAGRWELVVPARIAQLEQVRTWDARIRLDELRAVQAQALGAVAA